MKVPTMLATWWTRVSAFASRLTLRRVTVVGLLSLPVILAGTTVVAFAYDRVQSDKLLPGVKIAGVDVGGMSRDAAVRTVRKPVRYRLAHHLAIHAGKRTFFVIPKKLGVTPNVAGAVDRALAAAGGMTWFDRSYHRLFGWSVGESVPVTNWLPERHVHRFVDHLVADIDRPVKNAAIVMSADRMRLVRQHATKGIETDPKVVLRRVVAALRTARREVTVPVHVTRPKVGDRELGKTVTVDLSSNELHLWNGFHVAKTYPVATAQPGFSTPVGRWKVIDKVEMPSWTNPDPTGWGAGEPLYIPPGPSNPLGLRAMYLNAEGIRIHGTPDSGSIGTYASHGCIRMYESDVLALYPMVPPGTPVVIYGSPPWGTGGPSGIAGT